MISWLLFIAAAAAIGFVFWHWRRREEERKRAAEERLATFMAQVLPAAQIPSAAQTLSAAQAMPAVQAAPRADAGALLQQKLLLEAASKAGEAGEAALSIQLYARLLSRYPDSSFAGLARAAVEEQKKKLARPQSSG